MSKHIPWSFVAFLILAAYIKGEFEAKPKVEVCLPYKAKEADCVQEFQQRIDSILYAYVLRLVDKGIFVPVNEDENE